jgi:hypothetical protein
VDGVTQVQNVPSGSRPGQFIPVRITGGRGYDLEAEALQPGADN